MAENTLKSGGEIAQEVAAGQVIEIISTLLIDTKLPFEMAIPTQLVEDPAFEKLFNYIMDMRNLSSSLSRGELHNFVYSKGYILSNLKALQGNLRHLTWQTKMVAEGDFSQRVDFLGDFSSAFNEMTVKLKNNSEQMEHLATYDMLTHVPNRLSLDQFLEEAFENAKKSGRPLSILMIDIDRFKEINDTYGHAAGDKVLVNLCEQMNTQLRTSDFFARYGGEEFVTVLPNTDIALAQKIADRVLEKARSTKTEIEEGLEIPVTISIGVSQMKLQEDLCYDSIIARSDKAVYQAKRNGRNQVARV